MLSTDQLTELVGSGEVETVIVAFSDHYGRLCGKRYDAEFFLEEIVAGGTHTCYYLFATSYRDAASSGYRDRDLEPAGWYLEDYQILQGTRTEAFTAAVRRHLKQSGVPVENSKGEWGLGQHELNVRYADILETADRHVVYKQCLKEVAEQQGSSV